MILILKLLLAPTLVAAVTLCARRWGPRIGGWLTSMPIVAGPILCFYAVDQGEAFASRAAAATVAGVCAITAFAVAYAHACRRLGWLLSMLVGWTAFGLVTAVLYRAQPALLASLALAILVSTLAERLIPPPAGTVVMSTPSGDLPVRMLATAALVIVLTEVADWLGPSLSGLLTPFPIATGTIAAFSQAQGGPDAALAFFRGFVGPLKGFAIFCFVFAWAIVPLGLGPAVVAATASQLLAHGLMLWTMTRGQRSLTASSTSSA